MGALVRPFCAPVTCFGLRDLAGSDGPEGQLRLQRRNALFAFGQSARNKYSRRIQSRSSGLPTPISTLLLLFIRLAWRKRLRSASLCVVNDLPQRLQPNYGEAVGLRTDNSLLFHC